VDSGEWRVESGEWRVESGEGEAAMKEFGFFLQVQMTKGRCSGSQKSW
jgi:hypothetical protein